jgi:methylmalonyl-CoA/ethylmalonyl-CoA epimerase
VPAIPGPEGAVAQACAVVPDLEAAIAAHLAVAECGSFSIWTYDPGFFGTSTYRGEPTPYAARVAISSERPQLEYVELIGGPSVFHDHVATHGHGLHHLGWHVVDVGAVSARMAAAGFPVVQHHTGWGLDGDGEAAFYDTRAVLGYWTEAASPPRRRRPPDAVVRA